MSLLLLESWGNINVAASAATMRRVTDPVAFLTTPTRYTGFSRGLRQNTNLSSFIIPIVGCTFPIYFGYGIFIDYASISGTAIGPFGLGCVAPLENTSLPQPESLAAYLNRSGHIDLWQMDTDTTMHPLDSSQEVNNLGSWHFIEGLIDIGNDGDAATTTIKVDGVVLVTSTGTTYIPAGHTAKYRVPKGALVIGTYRYGKTGSAGANGIGIVITDMYVCDSAGNAPFNTYLNDIAIESLRPTGDSATYTEWTPLGGGTHYTEVDEVPPDGDTSYVQATTNKKDTYTFPALAHATGNVRGVQVRYVGRQIDPHIAYYQNGIVRRAGVDGSPNALTPVANMLTPYISLGSVVILETDPTDNSAWSIAKVNAAEFGPRRA